MSKNEIQNFFYNTNKLLEIINKFSKYSENDIISFLDNFELEQPFHKTKYLNNEKNFNREELFFIKNSNNALQYNRYYKLNYFQIFKSIIGYYYYLKKPTEKIFNHLVKNSINDSFIYSLFLEQTNSLNKESLLLIKNKEIFLHNLIIGNYFPKIEYFLSLMDKNMIIELFFNLHLDKKTIENYNLNFNNFNKEKIHSNIKSHITSNVLYDNADLLVNSIDILYSFLEKIHNNFNLVELFDSCSKQVNNIKNIYNKNKVQKMYKELHNSFNNSEVNIIESSLFFKNFIFNFNQNKNIKYNKRYTHHNKIVSYVFNQSKNANDLYKKNFYIKFIDLYLSKKIENLHLFKTILNNIDKTDLSENLIAYIKKDAFFRNNLQYFNFINSITNFNTTEHLNLNLHSMIYNYYHFLSENKIINDIDIINIFIEKKINPLNILFLLNNNNKDFIIENKNKILELFYKYNYYKDFSTKFKNKDFFYNNSQISKLWAEINLINDEDSFELIYKKRNKIVLPIIKILNPCFFNNHQNLQSLYERNLIKDIEMESAIILYFFQNNQINFNIIEFFNKIKEINVQNRENFYIQWIKTLIKKNNYNHLMQEKLNYLTSELKLPNQRKEYLNNIHELLIFKTNSIIEKEKIFNKNINNISRVKNKRI